MTQSHSLVASLFENRYAIGLAALVNSLYAGGFRGTVVAGYKGQPPGWYTGEDTVPGCKLLLRPLETSLHLTNYKPQFMKQVIAEFAPDRLYYFDPDIVTVAPWHFFEQWTDAGVALCEDVNSPMPDSHPIRHQWRTHLTSLGRPAVRPVDLYVNGGFVGVHQVNFHFLDEWETIQASLEPLCGSHVRGGPADRGRLQGPHPFVYVDQDALNLAAMATPCPLSVVGKDGMGIVPGGYIMAHALGTPKPWDARFTLQTLRRGGRPSPAAEAFFRHLDGPIRPVPKSWVRRSQSDLYAAKLLGRVWH